jgi:hypothetical protein
MLILLQRSAVDGATQILMRDVQLPDYSGTPITRRRDIVKGDD